MVTSTSSLSSLLVLSLALGSFACSSAGKPPVTTTSAGQTAYATGYSDEVVAATKAITDGQTHQRQLVAGFGARVDEMKRPDWDKVATVITDSDEAGKSADFADAHGEAAVVRTFWDAEKNEITARVNGNAQHTMKQAGCTAETAGPIAYSLNEAISKQLQKKLRSKNEAFIVIERYKTQLGPQNTATLEKLADEIAEASYDVHVHMVVQRNRFQRLAADKDDVKKTLRRFVQEETAYQGEPGRTEAEKRASQERIAAANKNLAELDKSGQQLETIAKQLDKSVDDATKEYDDAIRALKAKVAEKKKAEPDNGSKAPPPPAAAPAAPAPATGT